MICYVDAGGIRFNLPDGFKPDERAVRILTQFGEGLIDMANEYGNSHKLKSGGVATADVRINGESFTVNAVYLEPAEVAHE